MDKATTPWGRATVVEEAIVEQQVDGVDFEALVQLLELGPEEQALRFGARRARGRRLTCLTLRASDLEELAEALADTPRLATVLRLGLG